MRAKLLALFSGLLLAASSVRAQSNLSFALTTASQPGVSGNSIIFSGTLVNQSSSSNLYLNNIQITFLNAATNYLGAGTNTFFANVPGLLLPSETYSDVVFSVSEVLAAPPGDYSGSVTLQGGSDIFASSNLVSATFLLTSADTVGDGIPDWWRQQYFGGSGTTTNSQSCATCDADNTGQPNLFKYVAGLDPTNPASVFVLGISNITTLPNHPDLTFGPAVAGRLYTVQFSTNFPGGAWVPLNGTISQQSNSNQISVADGPIVQAQRFYRVQIALP